MDEQRWQKRAASFGAAAQVYDRSRPTYPVDAVRAALPADVRRVVDVGAGTGKLTRVLLDLGFDVVAVEPDAGMRALLPARAEALDGSAEAIALPDGSVDAVLAGQAFHWFDPARALPEMARVLRPGGTVGLLWNLRDTSVDWVREVGELWGDDVADRLDGSKPFSAVAGLSDPELHEFSHVQSMDGDVLVDLAASRSAVLTMAEHERQRVLDAVRALAPADEPFDLPYRTVLWRSVRS
jgi:SAM-dependent methyltransferase